MRQLALSVSLLGLILLGGPACGQESASAQGSIDWDQQFASKVPGFGYRIWVRLRFIPSFHSREQIEVVLPAEGRPWLKYTELPFESTTQISAGPATNPTRRTVQIRTEEVLLWFNQIMSEIGRSAPLLARSAAASLNNQIGIPVDGTEYECVVKISAADTDVVWRSIGPELMPDNHQRGNSMVELMLSLRREASKLLPKRTFN